MRLLNTSTLEVQEFLESRVPEYVILSHTWREEEVTLQDLLSGKAPAKKGYSKLTGCCKKAKADGFTYCWIDTCCIDKTSSAELSEAINSMYQWYKNARICYAYLEDVFQDPETDDFKAFGDSKWFTRGWTLQELIAPPIVEFYNASWLEIGTRSSLHRRLTDITGINRDVLTGGSPFRYAVVVRLSWAAHRETSRLEDQAYCLFGILGVNMPLLYGEGKRAFRRLQEEMLRVDEDYTIFAWDAFSPSESLLASSLSEFQTFTPVRELLSADLAGGTDLFHREDLSKTCFSVLPPPKDHSPPHLTSRGCHLSLPLFWHQKKLCYGCLACLESSKSEVLLLCVMLYQVEGSENRFERDWDTTGEQGTLILLHVDALKEFQHASIYVTTSREEHGHEPGFGYLSSFRYQHEVRSMVRIAIDPAFGSEIERVHSNKESARPFPMEVHATDMIAVLPGMWSTYYTGDENDRFDFRFVHRAGVDLTVNVHVHVSHNPWFTAIIERSGRKQLGVWRRTTSLKEDRTLDRTTLRAQNPTSAKDFEWSIRLSIRPTVSSPISPNTKQYVLRITKIQPSA